MAISIVEFLSNNYQDLRRLVKELQIFESKINAYRSTTEEKYDQITSQLIETIQEKEGKLLLAINNNQIIGFIGFYIDYDVLNKSKHVYVSDLIVTEKFRGNGVASLLMSEAEKFSKLHGISTVRVAVLDKSQSKGFYMHQGFTQETIEFVKDIK